MTKDLINFGLVGCGRVSPKHLEALHDQIPHARLCAVCDTNFERAQKAGTAYDVPSYDSLEAMLDGSPDIDVVDILTPSGLHAEHAVIAAGRKKHVIVEKPLALTIPDGERIIAACRDAGVKLFVVKQNRFNVPIQHLRDAVRAGRFGKLVMGTVRVRWCRTQEYYDQDAWRGTWAMDGGVIVNQASHHIDLLTWLMGDVESVFAYTTTRLVNIEADDTAVAVLRFTSGALGVIEATTGTRPKDLEGSISILGAHGSVEVGGFAANVMKTWQFSNPEPDDQMILQGSCENPPSVYGFGHKRCLNEIVRCLREETSETVDGEEGLRSLTLINAMYESMETGREVKLRWRPDHVKLGRPKRG